MPPVEESEMCEQLYDLVREFIPDDKLHRVAEEFCEIMSEHNIELTKGDTQIEKDAGINQPEEGWDSEGEEY